MRKSISTLIITGAGGYIGTHLTIEAINKGYRVIAYEEDPEAANILRANVNRHTSEPDLLTLAGPISRRNMLADLIDVKDAALIHLAANINATESITEVDAYLGYNNCVFLEAIRGCMPSVSRVIYASSASVYGSYPTVPTRETHPTVPITPYGWSKLTNETLAHAFDKSTKIEFCGARIFNAYGRGVAFQKRANNMSFTDLLAMRAMCGAPMKVYGDGKQTRDFIHVEDIAKILIGLRESAYIPEVVNVGTGMAMSLIDVIRSTVDEARKPIRVVIGEPVPGDVSQSCADVSVLTRLELLPQRRNIGAEIARAIDITRAAMEGK